MVYLKTNDFGRVTLRHNYPEQIDTSGGIVVDSVPERPDDGYVLFVIDGSPVWKRQRYQYRNDLPALKEHLKQKLKEQRHEVETRGVDYNGHTFGSDAESRQSVIETLEYARDQQSFSTVWKTQDGYMQDVTEADLVAVRDKIASLRQAAFQNEANIAADIESATDASTLLSIDLEVGWP